MSSFFNRRCPRRRRRRFLNSIFLTLTLNQTQTLTAGVSWAHMV